MALKPFVFHLHRYCWNVLLLALASALLSLCGCVCVQGRDVHTLEEEFPVFEVHPQTACTITNSFFFYCWAWQQSDTQKKRTDIQKESGGREKNLWIRSTSHRCCSPMMGVESPKPCLANNNILSTLHAAPAIITVAPMDECHQISEWVSSKKRSCIPPSHSISIPHVW